MFFVVFVVFVVFITVLITMFISVLITKFISAAVAGGRWSLAAGGAVGAERGAGPRATIGAATVFAGPAGDARERTIAARTAVRVGGWLVGRALGIHEIHGIIATCYTFLLFSLSVSLIQKGETIKGIP